MLIPLVTKNIQWDYRSTIMSKECECEGISIRIAKEIEKEKENFEIGKVRSNNLKRATWVKV